MYTISWNVSKLIADTLYVLHNFLLIIYKAHVLRFHDHHKDILSYNIYYSLEEIMYET